MDHFDIVGASSELELCRARVKELKAALEFERRMRRQAESLNEVLAVEISGERRRSETAEAACRRLQEEAESNRAELERALDDIEEERRMLRVAELWREERVQMKLAEAKATLEEKLQEIAELSGNKSSPGTTTTTTMATSKASPTSQQSPRGGQLRREAGENPHIRRGIKGFVEFPKAIRVQSKEERVDLESNLECQRAQLRVLMRHRNPPAAAMALVGPSGNLVM